jgi:TRAP-type C4-dicarboxylate transport system substrate-binding protein
MRKLLSLAAAMLAGFPALAQDTITATHVFPASQIYSRSFLEYVKKANQAGKGVFAIQVRGGPEAIPMMEQPRAARDGVVDMV